MNRSFLIHLHLAFAALLLPVILMFAVTGAFYTWGIKGGFETTEHDIVLSQPLQNDAEYLHQWLEDVLEINGIQVPSGDGRLKGKGKNYTYEWAGSARVATVAPTSDALVAKLTINESSYYRYLVQLHKGKGGVIFKVYAVVVAVGLVLLALSGVIMALRMPKYKVLTQRYLLSGGLLFVVLLLLS
ncbi:MAG TPA: hypothetical protein DIC30_08910 [Oceanospirillales bacterium]|nr:hypothetical protein [Oleispira sp.]HCM06113.1 hypothetical protein [Oceanospirillales bacterium]|tara:strand:- start:2414 stop:2971 length:558 start_codon:yes stop_codon:yes gene_type:complete